MPSSFPRTIHWLTLGLVFAAEPNSQGYCEDDLEKGKTVFAAVRSVEEKAGLTVRSVLFIIIIY